MPSEVFRSSLLLILVGCSSPYSTSTSESDAGAGGEGAVVDDPVVSGEMIAGQALTAEALEDFDEVLGESIDLDNLPNYVSQEVPSYILGDNGGAGASDEVAVLGRVLFYDETLSANNSTSCSTCHQQAFAFGDPEVLSTGAFGTTGRHSMRLVNARFSEEPQFFWDERAESLEQQTTMPIVDHSEMGFSGQDGDPSFDDLIGRLSARGYYQVLFSAAFGDPEVSEERMQEALAAFVRSIQSFDSPYDEQLLMGARENADFPGFSDLENEGKRIFATPPEGAGPPGAPAPSAVGAGCAGCHRPPTFDIDPNSLGNAFAGEGGTADDSVTRSPTLRDLFGPSGELNGPMMHNGLGSDLDAVLDHYLDLAPSAATDPRLAPDGAGQQIDLSSEEREALIAFLRTLGGSAVYSDERWSDPF